jgi:phage shock protein PspC (stress-responsive transcriptional regulator)
MSTATGSPVAARTPLRRDPQNGMVGGVLAGLGARIAVDPVILRVSFVIGAVITGGLLILAYVVAWAALPVEGEEPTTLRSGRIPRVRSDWRVATGVGLLVLSILLAFRELGIWWSDALVWPLVLASFGAALLWGHFRSPSATRAPARAWADLYRGIFGVLFVIGAGLLFLAWNDFLGGLRDAAHLDAEEGRRST